MSGQKPAYRYEGHVTCERQFTVRCADGHHDLEEESWTTVEEADRSAKLWDADCECGGPHSVMVRWRHEAITAWEPWEFLDA